MTKEKAISYLGMAVPLTALTVERFAEFCEAIRMAVQALEEEPHWNLCSETADLPDHEVLCCDLRGNMLVGYLYTDENFDTGFGAESSGECLVDCVAWREKPESWHGG